MLCLSSIRSDSLRPMHDLSPSSRSRGRELAPTARSSASCPAYRSMTPANRPFASDTRSPGSWAAPARGRSSEQVVSGQGTPYWKRALRYCHDHDLQSVLDEYFSVLARDAPSGEPLKSAKYIVESVHVAMRTSGRLSVSRPAGVFGTAEFARALGERESERR